MRSSLVLLFEVGRAVWHENLHIHVVLFQYRLEYFVRVFALEVEAEIVVLHKDLHATEVLLREVYPAILLIHKTTLDGDCTEVKLKALFWLRKVTHDDKRSVQIES